MHILRISTSRRSATSTSPTKRARSCAPVTARCSLPLSAVEAVTALSV